MRPVMQTREGPLGNCYAACVASILECDLAEVPDLVADWRGGGALCEWAFGRGLGVVFLHADRSPAPRGYAILSAEIRPDRSHAVVAFDGAVVHDPSPRPQWTPDAVPSLWTTFTKGNG